MMLHRHFEEDGKPKNITKLEDVTPKAEFVSEVFPPDETPKRKTRAKRSEE